MQTKHEPYKKRSAENSNWRTTADSDILTGTDTLQGEEVSPGFTLPVREIFALPYVQNV